MEASQSDAETSGPQQVEQKLQMSCKPLHRFIKGEPKSLGVILKILWKTGKSTSSALQGSLLYYLIFIVVFSRLLFYFSALQSS